MWTSGCVDAIQPPMFSPKHRLHLAIGHRPALALPLLRYRGAAGQVVRRDTDILIEGAAGSGNTFAHVAFAFAEPDARLAGHTHVPAQVVQAVRWNIPTLILIREPLDAVTSMVIRVGSPAASIGTEAFARILLDRYIHFYESIAGCGGQVWFCTFPALTKDFGAIIDDLNTKFGTRFRPFRPEMTEACLGDWRPNTEPAHLARKRLTRSLIEAAERLYPRIDRANRIWRRYV